jgi:hypothetical protein
MPQVPHPDVFLSGGVRVRPEDNLQKSVCEHLDIALPISAWYCAVPNGSVLAGDKVQRARQMNKLKSTGLKVGAPDLVICWSGRFIGIELKAGKGSLSDNQKDVSDKITLAGGLWSCCRSLGDVEAFLTMLGVPLRAKLLV